MTFLIFSTIFYSLTSVMEFQGENCRQINDYHFIVSENLSVEDYRKYSNGYVFCDLANVSIISSGKATHIFMNG